MGRKGIKIGRDGLPRGDAMQMKPRKIVPPSNTSEVDREDKEVTARPNPNRQNFITEEEREEHIRKLAREQPKEVVREIHLNKDEHELEIKPGDRLIYDGNEKKRKQHE